jgi:hypothetical protein
MFVRAAVFGRLREAMKAEVRAVASGLRRAVTATGREVQSELRAQARSAGFKDGGRSIANAWRLNVYPRQGIGTRTLRPAALVSSRMPEVVDAFDSGKTIMARGGKYMAFPTGYNASRGRRVDAIAKWKKRFACECRACYVKSHLFGFFKGALACVHAACHTHAHGYHRRVFDVDHAV